MRLLGLQIARAKAVPATTVGSAANLIPVDSNRGWFPLIREPYAGAWQRNDEWSVDTVLAFHAVYACITLIANDIGKLRIKLVQRSGEGVWTETTSPAFSPLLRKPNAFQTHIQFKEWWMTSKLVRGNAYALKVRDQRGVVVALYVLDPSRVVPLVAPDGGVYYQLRADPLSRLLDTSVVVPASEIIHDRMNCLFHPLVGVSPLFAAGATAQQGLRIQDNSSHFFDNGAIPSGILVAPGPISQQTADEMRRRWEEGYSGENAGRIAVVGDGLKFEPLRMTAVDSQLIEQMRFTAEIICSVFHVPPHKIGVGTMPAYNNIEALNLQYYSQCLQSHIENFELCMDEGLGLDAPKDGVLMGTELDIDNLLRMDTATQVKTLSDAVAGTLLTPNEARLVMNRKPLVGGDTVYMQQQNYSIEALAERDAEKPFARLAPASQATPPQPNASDDGGREEEEQRAMYIALTRAFEDATA